MKKETPQFTHDCNKCKFHGNYGPVDIYTCSNITPTITSIIVRYGNNGSEYTSQQFLNRGASDNYIFNQLINLIILAQQKEFGGLGKFDFILNMISI